MFAQLLVRDIMRIGVATCRLEDAVDSLAARMLEGNTTALVVLDDEGDSRGWINERRLVLAYLRAAAKGTSNDSRNLTAADIMEERVPECPADIPVTAAAQIMMDMEVDHLFLLHHAGGRAWPASVLSYRDVVRVLAGSDYVRNQGAAAPRPTPLDLFRQRYGLPKKDA